MKTVRKNIYKKLSQSGSMMIEAMAMLALIALVTPTLYKKSAERTTELQDINTATHVRTLTKAVDNYVSANYQDLLEGDLATNDAHKEIDLTNAAEASVLSQYLPYGYSFTEVLKNFETPKVVLKRQGDSGSITSFVQLPKKTEIGEMRAARIASMIGSNGGYVNTDNAAKGVGGVWSLSTDELTSMGLKTDTGSVVVASSEAINSATSGALENEKYLQRTGVENKAEKWRNAMSTDLYMGGVSGADPMYRILGVKQMIVGSSEDSDLADLVLASEADNGGSAWLAGNLAAVSGAFTVEGTSSDDAVMIFGKDDNPTLYADNSSISFNSDDVVFSYQGEDGTDVGAEFNVKTQINKDLDVYGHTHVAQDADTVFKAGPGGGYITAENDIVDILGGNIVTGRPNADGSGRTTTISTDLTVTENTNLHGKTTVGVGDQTPKFIDSGNLNLDVQGNAFVSDTLEAQHIKTNDLDVAELHAGYNPDADTHRWLNATTDGVIFNDSSTGTERLRIDRTVTRIAGVNGFDSGGPQLELGSTDAILQGTENVHIRTENKDGIVSLQKGLLVLDGHADADESRLSVDSKETFIDTDRFTIEGTKADGVDAENILDIDTTYGGSTTLMSARTDINTEDLIIQTNPLLQVLPNGFNADQQNAVVQISPNQFSVGSSGATYSNNSYTIDTSAQKEMLGVEVSDINPKASGSGSQNSTASVYIRRGAVELETYSNENPFSGAEGTKTEADAGMGYIEASRFVSNAVDSNNKIATPVVSLDYGLGQYNSGTYEYDKYMVNPAYTSVMHDIKLTTRGGARLSDILPDFINKGIYVVTNTYTDNIDINNIKAFLPQDGGQIALDLGADVSDITSTSGTLSGKDRWASPFMGIVPAPQCPPGHARVITITPAGFQMANAGKFQKEEFYKYQGQGSKEHRYLMSPSGIAQPINDLGDWEGADDEIPDGARKKDITTYDSTGTTPTTYYVLAYEGKNTAPNGDEFYPEPITFQQSTWLRSKTIPQKDNVAGCCGEDPQCKETCGERFLGWSAIMGFVYPGNLYENFITNQLGITAADDKWYWNIFPVATGTMEAYATVYCYFDRSNIFDSGNDSHYVDQYDQLNRFRIGYDKWGDTRDNTSSTGAKTDNYSEEGKNTEYLERLNDPTLKYDNPW